VAGAGREAIRYSIFSVSSSSVKSTRRNAVERTRMRRILVFFRVAREKVLKREYSISTGSKATGVKRPGGSAAAVIRAAYGIDLRTSASVHRKSLTEVARLEEFEPCRC
jgi:hypothetical protein